MHVKREHADRSIRRKATFVSVSGRNISELWKLYLKPLEFSSPEIARMWCFPGFIGISSKLTTEWILIGIDNHP